MSFKELLQDVKEVLFGSVLGFIAFIVFMLWVSLLFGMIMFGKGY